jgi:Family of unknown function (DUF6519)
MDIASQPYIPKAWPFGGTNPFAIPAGAGPHLVYLDVWKREVTYLQAGDLVDKAVGLDTTTRLQTAWQVDGHAWQKTRDLCPCRVCDRERR